MLCVFDRYSEYGAKQTVATMVLFSYDKGKLEMNSRKALSDAIAHGFQDKINSGIENEYKLSFYDCKVSGLRC